MTVTIQLSQEQRERLNRPNNMERERMGGFQRLIEKIQAGMKLRPDGWELELDLADARRVLEYTDPSHGPGTYQTVLGVIRPDVVEALRPFPLPKQESLFGEEEDAPAAPIVGRFGDLLDAIRGSGQ